MSKQNPTHSNTLKRAPTRGVKVGDLIIGGMHPITVQSMTDTDTRDLKKTSDQIKRLESAGCEIIRLTFPDRESLAHIENYKKMMSVPLVADIHFNHELALGAIERGVDKVRINPGNIGSRENFREIILQAKRYGTALRIGVNSGSLEKDILEKHGHPTAAALVESALKQIRFCEENGFDQMVISIKSSDVRILIESNELLAQQTDYPLHIGLTEAGLFPAGAIKSSLAMGTLLMKGIGNTIRVSLTGDPVQEIAVAFDILKSSGARICSPEIIACPGCGRLNIDLDRLVKQVEQRLAKCTLPIKVSVLGCIVNGPGEAKEADLGIAGGGGKGMLFKNGKLLKTLKEEDLLAGLMAEIQKLENEREHNIESGVDKNTV